MFVASMTTISIPATSSPTVTFRVDPVITTGVPVDDVVAVNVYIDAPLNTSVIAWAIDIKVDPAVLKPGYNGWVAWTGTPGYFLYDWCDANDWRYPGDTEPTLIFDPTKNETTGTITDHAETIKLWRDLEVGNGTDGTGPLATFYFTSKSETAYSLIEITKAYYYTSWKSPDVDERVPDLVINGHYNVPKHEVVVDGKTYYVTIESNSSFYNFAFNETYAVGDWRGETSFNVTGLPGTTGFCNVTIPKNLTYGVPWLVLVDGAAKGYASGDIDATSTWLYFTYTHGDTPSLIQIRGTWVVPEFSAPTLLMTLLIVALAVAILAKRASSNRRRHL
jgi:hypothetical protein